MMKCRVRVAVHAIIACVFCSVVTGVMADEPEGYALECYQGGETVFTSSIADIGEFDAESYGVTLQYTIELPAKNAVIYQYGQTDILCVVVTEE